MNANRLMKWMAAVAVLTVSCVGNAWADRHGHVHFGVVIGPTWGPYYAPYPRPLYYYPPYAPVVIERTPPVYIEQTPPPVTTAPPTAPTSYWYYCAATRAYYPYVNECPGGWMKVVPQTPAQ